MYHNHEDNIKLARDYIALFASGGGEQLSSCARNQLTTLLASMVEDAETGHIYIEQLTKKLEERLPCQN